MRQATVVLITSFCANLFLSIAKIVVGILGTSHSLIADGLHSFSDLATDVVALFGNRMASRPADREHPFGHGRVEYITSMFIALTIFGLGFSLIRASIIGTNQIPNIKILILVIITMIIKLIVSGYLLRSGKKLENQILIASGKESFTDVISSFLVLIVVILSQFQDRFSILAYTDRFGGILIGVLILITGFLLLRENISILIGRREFNSEIIDRIFEYLDDLDLNAKVFDVILMKYGPYYQATIILDIKNNKKIIDFREDAYKIKRYLAEYFDTIEYVDVQLNLE